jgi:hypothetical protein
LFRQTAHFTPQEERAAELFFINREKLRIWKWLTSAKLGTPISAQGFQCEWDESCVTTLSDMFMSAVGGAPVHRRVEDRGAHAISDSCWGLEKQIIKFSTYHTIACPLTCCCADFVIDEVKDAAAAKAIAHQAERSLYVRFSENHTIDCCNNNLPDDLLLQQMQEKAMNNSACAKLLDGQEVALCGSFDYRDSLTMAWENFATNMKSVWDRFLGYRTIGCCASQDEYDGPVQILNAKHRFEYYHDIHKHVRSACFYIC